MADKKKKTKRKTKPQKEEPIDDYSNLIPDEVLLHLFSFLRDARSLCFILSVCRRWKDIGQEPLLWKPIALTIAPEIFKDKKKLKSIHKKEPAVFKEAVKKKALENRIKKAAVERFRKITKEHNEVGWVPVLKKRQPQATVERKRKEGNGQDMIKLTVVGDGSTGKTCTLISWTTNAFPGEYLPSLFENYVTSVNLGAETFQLSLWDTCGGEYYDRLAPLSYPFTDIFLILFALNYPGSLESVKDKWVPELAHVCPGTPFVLGGSKLDILENPEAMYRLQQRGMKPVTVKEATAMAEEVGAEGWMPYSSLTGKNLKELFDRMIKIGAYGPSIANEAKSRCVLC